MLRAVTFRDWQQMSAGDAARALRADVERLSPAQQRAAIAVLADENELATQFASPRTGPLGGVPYFAKDLFDVAGQPTYAGSTFLPEVRPTPSKSSAIIRALTDLGAV